TFGRARPLRRFGSNLGDKRGSRVKRPSHTEADIAGGAGEPEARGAAEGPREEVPGTAANDMAPITAGCRPGRAISSRTAIVLVPTILSPLPCIAVNVVEPPWIGFETAHWHSALPIYAFASSPFIDVPAIVIGLSRRNGRTPPERRRSARA